MLNRKVAIALITLTSTVMSTGVAYADPSPVTGVELNVDSSDFVAVPLTFDPVQMRSEAMAATQKLRSTMWDRNPYFRPNEDRWPDGTRLRDVARSYGITSKRQYIYPALDDDMTWIALQRASEANAYFSHTRPDGSSWQTATRNGNKGWAESLAAGVPDLTTAILQSWGEGEYQELVRQRGVWTSRDGHLIHMLHPKFKAYGFGAVRSDDPNVPYRTSFAAVASEKIEMLEYIPGSQRTIWMYRAPLGNETPTGILAGSPVQPAPPSDPEPSTPDPSNTPDPAPNTGDNTNNPLGDSGVAGIVAAVLFVIFALIGILQSMFGNPRP